jgi:hypothetical protein
MEPLVVDHVPIGTGDLSLARDRLERLGFAVTPRGAYRGTGINEFPVWPCHCVIFEDTWMDVIEHAPFDPELLAPTRTIYPGIISVQGMVFGTHELERARMELSAREVDVGEPYDLVRSWDLEAGDTMFALFGLGRMSLPGLAASVITRRTPDEDRLPMWTSHPNGARGVAGVTIAMPPEELPEAHLFRSRLPLQDADVIEYATPRTLRERYPETELDPSEHQVVSVRIRTSSLQRAAAALEKNGVPVSRRSNRVTIGPEWGPGCHLEFVL